MRPLTAYTTFKDFNVRNFVVVRPHDPDIVPFVNGKSKGWCCQGKGEWIFQDGEGSMVGSREEMIKFKWMTSIWGLLKWQVEM